MINEFSSTNGLISGVSILEKQTEQPPCNQTDVLQEIQFSFSNSFDCPEVCAFEYGVDDFAQAINLLSTTDTL